MCVIAIAETRALTRAEIGQQWSANPDGAGVSWIDGGRVYWRKGIMRLDDLVNIVESLPLPYVVHTRIATVGGVNAPLTHPFPLIPSVPLKLAGKTSKGVLYHNGHWSDYELAMRLMDRAHGPLLGRISDSRIMARLLAMEGADMITSVPTSQRVVVVTPQGITRYGSGWTNHDGMWTSNCHWQRGRRVAPAPSSGSLWDGTKLRKAKPSEAQQRALTVLGSRVSESSPSMFRWQQDDDERLLLLGDQYHDPDAPDVCTGEDDC